MPKHSQEAGGSSLPGAAAQSATPPAETASPLSDGQSLYTVIAQEYLSLRIRPDASSGRIKKLAPGAVVEVASVDGEFASVTEVATGYTGYALMNYLAQLPPGVSLPATDEPDQPGAYRVDAEEFLSLRKEPSTESTLIMIIEAGSVVDVRSFGGNFANVRYGDAEGYVLASYLSPAPAAVQDAPTNSYLSQTYTPGSKVHVILAENYASLRVQPDAASERLLKIPRGGRVAVLREAGQFTLVEDIATGERGYVLTRLLVTEEAFASMSKEPENVIRYIDALEFLTLRKEPAASSEALGTLPRGGKVTALGRAGDFSLVEDENGKRGYVLDGYLSELAIKDDSAELFTVAASEYISLREKAGMSSERIDRISAGKTVEVTGLDGLFARVRWNGKTGYILSGYLKSKDNTLYSSLSIVKPVEKYTPHQVSEDLLALAKRYPGRLTVASAGRSAEGRDIPVAVLGNPDAERHILIQAAIHGREHMTALLAVAQIEDMLARQDASYGEKHYGTLLDEVCFHILPMTNPDGVSISQTAKATPALEKIYAADLEAELTNLSLTDYLREWKANAHGIDLNRNFTAGWSALKGPSAPSSSRYKGEKASDQPETKALAEYTKKYDFDATVSYHSYGSMIYWEYGCDQSVLDASRSLARAVRSVTRYPLAGSGGLDAGGYKDWAMEIRSIPSITIETGTRSCPLPLDEFDMIWRRNREVLPALALWALEN